MASRQTPPGECPQCWYHAHNSKEAHAGLAWNEDCRQCRNHMANGCPGVVPKKKSSWW